MIAAQNNTIRTNYLKTKIAKTQQNSKCQLCSDRDETINHIISECSKLTQKVYKTRHGWMGKVIHRELCKKLKFDHASKWYMHKPESILENETNKILWDFEIQTDHLIPARRPAWVKVNKNDNLPTNGLYLPGKPHIKIQRKWKERQELRSCKRTIKSLEHEGDGNTN